MYSSEFTDAIPATLINVPIQPAKPNITDVFDNSITLSWSKVSNVNYSVQYIENTRNGANKTSRNLGAVSSTTIGGLSA